MTETQRVARLRDLEQRLTTRTPEPIPGQLDIDVTAGEPEEKWPTPPPTPVLTPYQCDAGLPQCGKPARLYPAGWRCAGHQPRP